MSMCARIHLYIYGHLVISTRVSKVTPVALGGELVQTCSAQKEHFLFLVKCVKGREKNNKRERGGGGGGGGGGASWCNNLINNPSGVFQLLQKTYAGSVQLQLLRSGPREDQPLHWFMCFIN